MERPKPFIPKIPQQPKNPSPEVGEIIATTRTLFFREYSLTQPDEETLQTWMTELQTILDAFASEDYIKIKETMMRDGKMKCAPSTALDLLETEISTPTELQMLAIGVWILINKSPWKGFTKASFQIAQGGIHPLNDAIDPDRSGNCFEAAVLIHTLANQLNIPGSIKKLVHHFLWQADSGHIIDPMFGYERAGFFKNNDQYRQFLKNNPRQEVSMTHIFPFTDIK